MGKKKDDKLLDPAQTVWEMFEKTGNISYYLLYKNITGEGRDPII